MPRVEFPDAEQMAGDFVRAKTGLPAGRQVPKPRPPVYVRVWRTGGRAVNQALERVQLTYEVWAPTMHEASHQALKVRRVLLVESRELALVRGEPEEISAPTYDPDPDDGTARYSGLVELKVRARRVTASTSDDSTP